MVRNVQSRTCLQHISREDTSFLLHRLPILEKDQFERHNQKCTHDLSPDFHSYQSVNLTYEQKSAGGSIQTMNDDDQVREVWRRQWRSLDIKWHAADQSGVVRRSCSLGGVVQRAIRPFEVFQAASEGAVLPSSQGVA